MSCFSYPMGIKNIGLVTTRPLAAPQETQRNLEDAGRDTVSSDREKRHGAEASDAADRNSFPARKVSKRSELLLIFP